jgi:hypothetical protein
MVTSSGPRSSNARSSLLLGVPRGPFFDHLDADTAKAMDEALRVLGTLTRSTADTTQPTVRDINVGAETYAYHREVYISRTHGIRGSDSLRLMRCTWRLLSNRKRNGL